MTRCTVTDVAWFTPAQPAGAAAADEDATADDAAEADDVAAAEDVPPAPAGAVAETEPHPASAEHSSTA